MAGRAMGDFGWFGGVMVTNSDDDKNPKRGCGKLIGQVWGQPIHCGQIAAFCRACNKKRKAE